MLIESVAFVAILAISWAVVELEKLGEKRFHWRHHMPVAFVGFISTPVMIETLRCYALHYLDAGLLEMLHGVI